MAFSKIKRVRLIIFDLDGTLVDAYKPIIRSFNYTMQRLKLPKQSIGVIRKAVGWGDKNLLRPFIKTRDLKRALSIYRKHHKKALLLESHLFSGTNRVLDYLKKKGYDKWIGQWLMIGGVPVEFIPAWDLSQEAVENAVKTEFEGIATKVIAPEYLIALLLVASRQKDAIKIRMLLKQAKVDIEKLKRITAKYGLSEKLESYFKGSKNE